MRRRESAVQVARVAKRGRLGWTVPPQPPYLYRANGDAVEMRVAGPPVPPGTDQTENQTENQTETRRIPVAGAEEARATRAVREVRGLAAGAIGAGSGSSECGESSRALTPPRLPGVPPRFPCAATMHGTRRIVAATAVRVRLPIWVPPLSITPAHKGRTASTMQERALSTAHLQRPDQTFLSSISP